uniref:Transposon Ty3-I Gag-Pol polyprotein n=1 Tax=Cajanus cajan TaxID=3821 RepID=A0A151STA8_CAJCA|nr:Transposon Ty3-I Gag-Pol polyprotein [Cajanus cajan]
MPGIDANFICHRLEIRKEARPVAQRKRKVGGERREAIIAETQKLLNVGFIREVRYTTWLANVILVKKSSGRWRMCVNYTDLNKACPKDSYPLSSIDRLVDGASGHALLSFLDAYSGYKQIMMYPPDEVHRSFITDHVNYCYKVMPFGLKNAGATYQRLMDMVFHQQIGRNMEVYVDDMVVKTISVEAHAADLAEVFSQIRKHNMRLNPEKCVFGVQGGKFLGFMITNKGIEANKSHHSHGALRAQCLADFVAELTPTSADEPQVWTLHVDRSSNSKGGGAGIILEGPNQVTLEQSLKFSFKVTNNQAKYEALLAGLRLARDLGARRLSCNSDSKLMVEQRSGTYQAKDTLQQRYFHMASQQISAFDEFTIHHVPREQNTRADLLSKLASTKCPGQHRTIIQETLHSPSLDDKVGMDDRHLNYLKEGTLPEDKDEARKMRGRSAKFVIVGDELFKRGISTPLLKWLTAPQAAYVIEEIHRGICGMHSGARSMVTRVLRAGYYWPTLKSDCQAYVQRCKECQQFGNTHRQPPKTLHQMMSSWPFAQWGMDIIGPFPPAKGQLKFLLVAIDYFTKWIEARPLARITTENIQKFTWKSIICKFKIPHSLVTDNGRQFIA